MNDEIAIAMSEFLAKTAGNTYTVKSTDKNVTQIARDLGLDLPSIQGANPNKDLNKIKPGDIINLPSPQAANRPDLDSIILDAAAKNGVDADLLKTLIWVESSNNPMANSGEAQGLTQLTPYAQKAVGVTNPFDPVQSVYGGARWLKIAIDEAKKLKNADPANLLTYALMIYHAGFGNVQAWINAGSPSQGYRDPASKHGVGAKTLNYPGKILSLLEKGGV